MIQNYMKNKFMHVRFFMISLHHFEACLGREVEGGVLNFMTHLLYNESAMISSQLKISGFTVVLP